MKKIFGIAILSIALGGSSSFGQTTNIYTSDFSVDGQGSTHDNTGADPFESSPVVGANWELTFGSLSSDSTINSFITSGGNMFVDDWGGLGAVTGDVVTIGAPGTVDFSGAGTVGDFTVAAEFFEWFYIINGVSTSFGNLGNSTTAGTVADSMVNGITVAAGDTVQIGFNINVNGVGDGGTISTLDIDFTPVPEPGSLVFFGLASLGMIARRRR